MANSVNQWQYGVLYTPKTNSIENGPALAISELRTLRIEFIRVQWVDLINNIRYRVLSIDYFERLLESARPGISITKIVFGLVFIAGAEGFSASGEYLYVPDMSSLRICPYAPRHASVMGYFQEKEPVEIEGCQTVEVDLCPRTILRRVIERAKVESGIDFLVGFETEFILLKSTSPLEAINTHGWSNAPALSSGTKEAQVLEEIADALKQAGIQVQMYHSEAAPGQYEMITAPLAPLEAADALVFTRETIYNIASRHGLRATLAPRVYMNNCGSGAHTHISVHPKSNKASPHSNLTVTEASFVAGVLKQLPSLMLINYPLTASYKRMTDGVWSGGTYACWGTENREAPIRLCNAASNTARNFELKTVDGTSNPYLVLAGSLGAGYLGIKDGLELKIKDAGIKTAATMSESERKEYGIVQRLPLDWDQATEVFTSNQVLQDIFGEKFVQVFLKVNKLLNAQMTDGLTEEEEMKRLIENY